eukprot:132844_1
MALSLYSAQWIYSVVFLLQLESALVMFWVEWVVMSDQGVWGFYHLFLPNDVYGIGVVTVILSMFFTQFSMIATCFGRMKNSPTFLLVSCPLQLICATLIGYEVYDLGRLPNDENNLNWYPKNGMSTNSITMYEDLCTETGLFAIIQKIRLDYDFPCTFFLMLRGLVYVKALFTMLSFFSSYMVIVVLRTFSEHRKKIALLNDQVAILTAKCEYKRRSRSQSVSRASVGALPVNASSRQQRSKSYGGNAPRQSGSRVSFGALPVNVDASSRQQRSKSSVTFGNAPKQSVSRVSFGALPVNVDASSRQQRSKSSVTFGNAPKQSVSRVSFGALPINADASCRQQRAKSSVTIGSAPKEFQLFPWTCKQCTFINVPSLQFCSTCGVENVELEDRHDIISWTYQAAAQSTWTSISQATSELLEIEFQKPPVGHGIARIHMPGKKEYFFDFDNWTMMSPQLSETLKLRREEGPQNSFPEDQARVLQSQQSSKFNEEIYKEWEAE